MYTEVMKWVSLGALNPSMPVFPLAGAFSLSLVLLAIAPFAISLATIKRLALLTIPSITDRDPGSQSL
jgi:hypothetical protein